MVLWVSGCSHHCEGCHNPQTWNPDSGIPFTLWDEAEFWEWLKKPWTQGATFSGGDPLHMVNRQKIGEMIHTMKAKYPDKDIWLYTGYRLTDEFLFESENDDSFSFQQLKDIDVLVDGRFDCRIRAQDLSQKRKVLWRGSSNQRIVDVKASLSVGRVVEKEV